MSQRRNCELANFYDRDRDFRDRAFGKCNCADAALRSHTRHTCDVSIARCVMTHMQSHTTHTTHMRRINPGSGCVLLHRAYVAIPIARYFIARSDCVTSHAFLAHMRAFYTLRFYIVHVRVFYSLRFIHCVCSTYASTCFTSHAFFFTLGFFKCIFRNLSKSNS